MNRAIVIGASGQDGSYLVDLLLAKGYDTLGTTHRSPHLVNFTSRKVDMVHWDLRDDDSLAEIFRAFKPDEVYNLAALSSGAGMFDNPVALAEINGLAVARILVAIERSKLPIRFCQASSSEVFGAATTSPQNESTPPHPRTPYGAAKLYADSMVQVFRRSRGLHASSAILFNHESPRRGTAFVTKKVTRAAARISVGVESELSLETLETRRDWGHARDYVEAMWRMLQQPTADDYVIATGVTHGIGDLCDAAFAAVGLSYVDFVKVGNASFRAPEAAQLVGDATRAREVLGWAPSVSFAEMIGEMVAWELANIGRGP